jgi:hypothetical protein
MDAQLTVIGVLVVLAFALTIANAINRCPLWIPVLLLALVHLISIVPLGRA